MSFYIDFLFSDKSDIQLNTPSPSPHPKSHEYRYVLVPDFRDVFFQADPMNKLERLMQDNRGAELILAGEHPNATFGSGLDGFNGAWIVDCYGRETLEPWLDYAPLNTGAIAGSRLAVMDVIERASVEAARFNFSCGIDQGFLNYLYFTGQLGDVPVYYRGSGLVSAIGQFCPEHCNQKGDNGVSEELYRDADGYVLDDDGERMVGVHQWDRHWAPMLEHLNRLLANDIPDHEL